MRSAEIDNLFEDFDELGFCPTTLCEDAEKYAIAWRNNMRTAIINRETDLLKEFVEWEYARYEGEGLVMCADDFAFAIRKDLGKFLEERK